MEKNKSQGNQDQDQGDIIGNDIVVNEPQGSAQVTLQLRSQESSSEYTLNQPTPCLNQMQYREIDGEVQPARSQNIDDMKMEISKMDYNLTRLLKLVQTMIDNMELVSSQLPWINNQVVGQNMQVPGQSNQGQSTSGMADNSFVDNLDQLICCNRSEYTSNQLTPCLNQMQYREMDGEVLSAQLHILETMLSVTNDKLKRLLQLVDIMSYNVKLVFSQLPGRNNQVVGQNMQVPGQSNQGQSTSGMADNSFFDNVDQLICCNKSDNGIVYDNRLEEQISGGVESHSGKGVVEQNSINRWSQSVATNVVDNSQWFATGAHPIAYMPRMSDTVPFHNKQKIWGGKFVDMKDLLPANKPNSNEMGRLVVQTSDKRIATLVQLPCKEKPLTYAEYQAAWRSYKAVYLENIQMKYNRCWYLKMMSLCLQIKVLTGQPMMNHLGVVGKQNITLRMP